MAFDIGPPMYTPTKHRTRRRRRHNHTLEVLLTTIMLLFLLRTNVRAKPETIRCQSTEDCINAGDNNNNNSENQNSYSYCASGICLAISTCNVREDCYNPNNNNNKLLTESCEEEDNNNNERSIDCIDSTCTYVCGIQSCPSTGKEKQDQTVDSSSCDDDCNINECKDAVACLKESCGNASCRVIYFDNAGNQVCKNQKGYDQTTNNEEEEEDKEPPQVIEEEQGETTMNNTLQENNDSAKNITTTQNATYCSTDNDCSDSEYCAAGVCLVIGSCNKSIDCENPSNYPYAAYACVGYIDCTDEGQCAMECSGAFCPDGSDLVDCDPQPCNIIECPEAVSCYNDNCGSCKAIFYDAAGKYVCMNGTSTNTNDDQTLEFISCINDAECLMAAVERSIIGEYLCAQGVCMEKGSCDDDSDCYNPSNIIQSSACVGKIACTKGVCQKECGPSCPNNAVEQFCEPTPCEANPVSSCPGAVACRNNQCNGCEAVYYDAAGFIISSCDRHDEINQTTDDANVKFLSVIQFVVLSLALSCNLLAAL